MPIVRKMAALAVLLASSPPGLAGAALAADTIGPDAAFNFGGAYTDGTYKNCTNMTYCTITMSVVPTGKSVTILNVSCYAFFTGPGTITSTILGGATHNTYLQPTLVSAAGTTKRYSMNNAAYEPYPAAFAPSVSFNTTAVETALHLECSIAGTIR